MSWNKEKDTLKMRDMVSKSIYEINLKVRYIADNLNNCEGFAVTAQGLRDHFTTLMKRYKSKTRQEVKGTGLGAEELSENEQLLEDLIEI